MIDINLIPVAQRRKAGLGLQINISREVLLGVGAAAFVVMLAAHCFLGFLWISKRTYVLALDNEWNQLLADRKVIDGLGEDVKRTNKKSKEILALVPQTATSWSHKLNKLSDAIPKGAWLSKLAIDERSIIIQGLAVSKQRNEIVLIGNLANTLKKDADFISDFSNLEVNSVNKAKFYGMEVTQFTLTARLKEALLPKTPEKKK